MAKRAVLFVIKGVPLMASRNKITQEHSQEHIFINGKQFLALDKYTPLVCGHFLLPISLRIRGIPL